MDYNKTTAEQPLVAQPQRQLVPAGYQYPPAAVGVSYQTGGYQTVGAAPLQPRVFSEASPGAQYVVAGVPAYVDAYGCALVGLILAFLIPLAGWITLCVNAHAPVGSKTRLFGLAAGVVGTAMFIVYFSIAYTTVQRTLSA
jgi:hypothetical protein